MLKIGKLGTEQCMLLLINMEVNIKRNFVKIGKWLIRSGVGYRAGDCLNVTF